MLPKVSENLDASMVVLVAPVDTSKTPLNTRSLGSSWWLLNCTGPNQFFNCSDGPALSAQLNNEKPTTEGRTVRTPNGKQQIGRIGGRGFYIDIIFREIEAALD